MKTPLLVVLTLLSAVDASAQTATDKVGLMRAAARYVATTLVPGESIALDTTRSYTRVPDAIDQTRVTDSVVAQALGAERVGARDDLITCPSGPPSCDLHGVDAIVRIEPLAIRGDTGLVGIRLTTRIPSARGPYVRGGAARFVKRNAEWTLVSFAFTSQS